MQNGLSAETLRQLIDRLRKFDARNDVSEAITHLEQLHDSVETEPETNTLVNSLRKELRLLVLAEEQLFEDPEIINVIFDVLIFLAQHWPLNQEDPILQTDIEENDKIVLSTGHQFNIHTLIEYHHSRLYRRSNLSELANSKWLLNPITNSPLNFQDTCYVQKIASSLGLAIHDLKTFDSVYEEAYELINYPDTFDDGEELLRQIAQAGYLEAAFLLAEIYRTGNPDYHKVIEYLKLAAAGGHSRARLGYLQLIVGGVEELGIPPNQTKAVQCLNQLVKQNNLGAIITKLYLLDEGIFEDEIDPVDVEFNAYKKTINATAISYSETIAQFHDFAKRGSLNAITTLIELYRSGSHHAGIIPNDEFVSYYQGLFDNLIFQKSVILDLLINASNLGHAESSYCLARIYLTGHLPHKTTQISIDVNQGLKFLAISASQGNMKAALELATIYLKKQLDNYNNKLLESVRYDVITAKNLLENAIHFNDETNASDKACCAYLLAQMYRENLIPDQSPADRRNTVRELYYFAQQRKHSEAALKLGVLSLIGCDELLIKPDSKLANIILCHSSSFDIACEIAATGRNNNQHIDYYLHYFFINLTAEDHHKFDYLIHFLQNGKALCAQKQAGTLSTQPREELANKWCQFKATYFPSSSTNQFFTPKKLNLQEQEIRNNEFQQLVEQTFTEFNAKNLPEQGLTVDAYSLLPEENTADDTAIANHAPSC